MKRKNNNSNNFAGIAGLLILGLFSLSSCKKQPNNEKMLNQVENKRADLLVQTSLIQNCNVTEDDYSEENVSNYLADFWANFSSYVGDQNPTDVVPDLNVKICYNRAFYYFHYVLNTAFVQPDTVYQNEQNESIVLELPVDDNDEITKSELCESILNVSNEIRLALNSISESKAVRDIKIEPRLTSNSGQIIINYKIVKGGEITSVYKWNSPINQTFTPSQPMFWITKSSYDNSRYGAGKNFFTYNMLGIKFNPTAANRTQAYAELPQATPVHQILTNRNIFWPNPVQQIAGWLPVYSNNIRPVKSLPFSNSTLERGFNSWASVIRPTNLVNCNAPNIAPLGITPKNHHLFPSDLLGWQTQADNPTANSSNDVRKVPINSISFYFYQRIKIVEYLQLQNASNISNVLSTKGGYYALTDLLIEPNEYMGNYGNCMFINCAQGFCDHNVEYCAAAKLEHYTNQSMPQNLKQYF